MQGPEDEDRYVQLFRDSEGIELDKNMSHKNAAKSGLAKLCLNSFWRKFTESSNRPQTRLITDPQVLYRFLVTPGIELTNLSFAGEEVVWVMWRYVEEENMSVLRHTNEFIGAYVKTGALLKLYTYLDALKEKALYCDTDSVIYIQKCGQPPAVTCGDKLGDMTSELGPDEYISEFVSGGPKNYAYKIVNAETAAKKTVCKVRGITLNYTASQLVKFQSIKDMILCADVKDVITVRTEREIKRNLRMCDGSVLWCRHGDCSVRTRRENIPSIVSQAQASRRFRLAPLRVYKGRAWRFHLSVCHERFHLICGRSGCGKTSFCVRLIANLNRLYSAGFS